MCHEERTEKKRSEKIEEENTMRKFLSVLLAMAMVLSLTVTGFAIEDTATTREPEVMTEEATMAGKTVILHTNDVHGAIAGYAYITALKADYEAKGAEVILVDAGDYSQGTSYVSVTKGLDAIEMMNAAGYDVVTLGNHEFDYGYTQLKDNMTKAKFKVLCADVFNADGTPIFDANYTYTTKSGVKVGFFGMETPETQTKANPTKIKGLTFATNDAFTKAAADQVEALKDADVVICLAHLGVDGESKPYRSTDLYAAVKGIDFIIDGHSHTVMTKGENGEPIQSTGTAFANIGVIVIDDATKKIESNSLFEIKEDTAKDATVAAAAQKIIDRIDKEYGAVFAKSEVVLNGAKAPNGNRDSETNNGDLITDAMVWKILQDKESLTVDADHVVAVTNGGGIRKAINPGDVTKKNINEVLPFGNTVVTIYITGAELLEALEASTYCTPDAIGGFPQVSGINYTISTAVAYDANAETYPASTYYGPKSINRVTINSINGKEFKADDTYAVITNDFCGGGGDTYYAFAAATAKFDTGIPLDEVVMEYITAELKGVIGKQYAAPQGRILMNPFKDVKTSAWYGSYVIDLYNDGIINGTSATTYAPNDTLTWGAALKLLLVSSGDLKAEDATGADWSKNTIAKAAELGLVAADLDGAKAISRLEFCQVAAKLNKLAESKTESKFTDCTDGYVMALVDAKVISGMTETTFEPAASLTRAQIAKILYQLTLIEK
ncbi:bifunctional metallophosphatase/5'-nucleotidase [Ruminococcaceae bacterium TF06-43]|nr:bifunctional metallophosphatase/5'-nucleotidase [Ruminococcaceae bacterium TF06-43]